MKKIIDFTKKHKDRLLILLVIFFFFRSCNNSNKVRKLEKNEKKNVQMIDSLLTVNDSISKIIPNSDDMELMKYRIEYDVYDKIFNEMGRRQITCGDFREKMILLPKEEINSKITILEKK
jgi:hypothetical protein